jgi:hypothetical protein
VGDREDRLFERFLALIRLRPIFQAGRFDFRDPVDRLVGLVFGTNEEEDEYDREDDPRAALYTPPGGLAEVVAGKRVHTPYTSQRAIR